MPLSYDIKEHLENAPLLRHKRTHTDHNEIYLLLLFIWLFHILNQAKTLLDWSYPINQSRYFNILGMNIDASNTNQSINYQQTDKLSYVPEMLHMHINWRVSDMNKYWLCATQIINQYCNKGTHDYQTNNKCLIWRDAYNLAKRKKSHVNFHNTCAHFC
jgi:hypothetical protein